jgi:hypothetical protein
MFQQKRNGQEEMEEQKSDNYLNSHQYQSELALHAKCAANLIY